MQKSNQTQKQKLSKQTNKWNLESKIYFLFLAAYEQIVFLLYCDYTNAVVSVTLWTVTSDTTREEEGVQLEFLGQSPPSTTHPRSEIIPNLHNHHGNNNKKHSNNTSPQFRNSMYITFVPIFFAI